MRYMSDCMIGLHDWALTSDGMHLYWKCKRCGTTKPYTMGDEP